MRVETRIQLLHFKTLALDLVRNMISNVHHYFSLRHTYISNLYTFIFKSRALLLSVLVLWLVAGSAILVGLVVFANYWSCDPLTSLQTNSNNNQASRISREDELVTLFVLDHLVDFLGIPGIFIASLLCGALRYKSNQLLLFDEI